MYLGSQSVSTGVGSRNVDRASAEASRHSLRVESQPALVFSQFSRVFLAYSARANGPQTKDDDCLKL